MSSLSNGRLQILRILKRRNTKDIMEKVCYTFVFIWNEKKKNDAHNVQINCNLVAQTKETEQVEF